MPHIIIDYSANLDGAVDIAALCDHLRRVAGAHEAFPAAGVRVRAIAADHWSIADGNPKHAYVDVSVRLRGGRPADVKTDATQTLFEAARDFLGAYMAENPLALSFEMRDIDPALSPKTGTIRDHLET